ncbi:hypothetical protein K377_03330 [Streptomyces sp. PsTaAH-137]|nr:hypothetical protein [Streptomyces sp. SID8367]MYT68809.1 hypothetical protein [Streptomyces sp. SID8367]RAJ86482.1 hypothetical protein K377_03330 [Streptomyces sp. PsTaAH-137]
MDSQKVTPVAGAGFDPASVPGLTSPAKETVVEDAQATEAEADEPAGEVSTPSLEKETPEREDAEDSAPEAAEDADAEEPAKTDEADKADKPAKAEKVDGATLEAKDRRGSITVDETGVRYTLDDQQADFTWDEISAVEYGTSRKRLTVTVHTPNSRWYPNDVEAPDKSRLKEWTESLDKALDAYFED